MLVAGRYILHTKIVLGDKLFPWRHGGGGESMTGKSNAYTASKGGKRQIELSKCACLLDIAADTAAFYQSFLPLVFICWLCGWVGRVGSRGGREGRQKKTINQCKHNESINK